MAWRGETSHEEVSSWHAEAKNCCTRHWDLPLAERRAVYQHVAKFAQSDGFDQSSEQNCRRSCGLGGQGLTISPNMASLFPKNSNSSFSKGNRFKGISLTWKWAPEKAVKVAVERGRNYMVKTPVLNSHETLKVTSGFTGWPGWFGQPDWLGVKKTHGLHFRLTWNCEHEDL